MISRLIDARTDSRPSARYLFSMCHQFGAEIEDAQPGVAH
jgi:hypothetical protein